MSGYELTADRGISFQYEYSFYGSRLCAITNCGCLSKDFCSGELKIAIAYGAKMQKS